MVGSCVTGPSTWREKKSMDRSREKKGKKKSIGEKGGAVVCAVGIPSSTERRRRRRWALWGVLRLVIKSQARSMSSAGSVERNLLSSSLARRGDVGGKEQLGRIDPARPGGCDLVGFPSQFYLTCRYSTSSPFWFVGAGAASSPERCRRRRGRRRSRIGASRRRRSRWWSYYSTQCVAQRVHQVLVEQQQHQRRRRRRRQQWRFLVANSRATQRARYQYYDY